MKPIPDHILSMINAFATNNKISLNKMERLYLFIRIKQAFAINVAKQEINKKWLPQFNHEIDIGLVSAHNFGRIFERYEDFIKNFVTDFNIRYGKNLDTDISSNYDLLIPKFDRIYNNRLDIDCFKYYFRKTLKNALLDEIRPKKRAIKMQIILDDEDFNADKVVQIILTFDERLDMNYYVDRFIEGFKNPPFLDEGTERLFFQISVLIWADWPSQINEIIGKSPQHQKAIRFIQQDAAYFKSLISKKARQDRLIFYYEKHLFHKEYKGELRKKAPMHKERLLKSVFTKIVLPGNNTKNDKIDSLLKILLDYYFTK